MWKSLLLVSFVVVAGLAYAVWPLLSAFEIKQAVHSGDIATLEKKVDWAPVRQSLKTSIAALPAESFGPQTATNTPGPYAVARPSLWTRIKAVAEPILADHMIDTYVNPKGIAELRRSRDSRLMRLLGMPPPEPRDPANPDGPSFLARFQEFYARIVHARFRSLGEVEIEMAEHGSGPRHIISQFVLSNFDWKLASVRIVPSPQ